MKSLNEREKNAKQVVNERLCACVRAFVYKIINGRDNKVNSTSNEVMKIKGSITQLYLLTYRKII
jgi:uncharacterized protein involved in tolerance to divalent cations